MKPGIEKEQGAKSFDLLRGAPCATTEGLEIVAVHRVGMVEGKERIPPSLLQLPLSDHAAPAPRCAPVCGLWKVLSYLWRIMRALIGAKVELARTALLKLLHQRLENLLPLAGSMAVLFASRPGQMALGRNGAEIKPQYEPRFILDGNRRGDGLALAVNERFKLIKEHVLCFVPRATIELEVSLGDPSKRPYTSGDELGA